ncbi:MAG TPA: SprT-like domain-containing protein [Gemmatimonadales bacterium]|nr:SprT-like domain-containing protein [Gemmatimonadales bacterium]
MTISLLEPEDLEPRLRRLGLTEVDEVRTHANRTVMLSLRRRVLRIHRGYAHAPDPVLAAIVRFLRRGTRRDTRRAAEREFLAFPVHHHVPPAPRRVSPQRSRPGDALMLERLRAAHAALNARHFAGALAEIPIRLSGRMRRRLGELVAGLDTGRPVAIILSRRHLRRDPWPEVEHTLLHEMVHQWQAEEGLPLDHGRSFRRKAREVGIVPRAVRGWGGQGGQGRVVIA